MARAFCVPGVLFLFAAFVLLILVSISLPYITVMDIARVQANGRFAAANGNQGLSDLRLGIWSYCSGTFNGFNGFNGPNGFGNPFGVFGGNVLCSNVGYGYSVTITSAQNNANAVTIGSAWTRGLALHPLACAVTFIALLLSFSQHVIVTLVASLVSFLAAALTLAAFAVDIALVVHLKNEANSIGLVSRTIPGPAFWLTFASIILLVLAALTVCCGRRRDRMAGGTTFVPGPKAGLFSRFGRNRV